MSSSMSDGTAPTNCRTIGREACRLAIAWSMMESASRMEPSPASARSESALSSASILGLGNRAQLGEDVVELDGVKSEVLAARADRLRNVFGLGGRHHEDDVPGGSSRVLSSALKAASVIWCASSRM